MQHIQALQLRHTGPASQALAPVDAALDDAIAKSVQANSFQFDRLPVPVRYRASGAIQAWEAARRAAGHSGRRLSEKLSDLAFPPLMLFNEIADFAEAHSTIDFTTADAATVAVYSSHSVIWQAFWLRRGALYEPTEAFESMLNATDIADGLPMRYVKTPAPAVCIIPPPSMRYREGGLESIGIFTHAWPDASKPSRCLTFVANFRGAAGSTIETLRLAPVEEDRSIGECILEAASEPPMFGHDRPLEEVETVWRNTLNYVVKTLLYLSLEQKQVVYERPYSTAPKIFPSLGKRKREMRLAEIDQLYDRYLVGPATVSVHQPGLPSEGDGHRVSAHWRRGHFRLQPHGPQSSLRKLMFIMPTLIHPDQLLDRE